MPDGASEIVAHEGVNGSNLVERSSEISFYAHAISDRKMTVTSVTVEQIAAGYNGAFFVKPRIDRDADQRDLTLQPLPSAGMRKQLPAAAPTHPLP